MNSHHAVIVLLLITSCYVWDMTSAHMVVRREADLPVPSNWRSLISPAVYAYSKSKKDASFSKVLFEGDISGIDIPVDKEDLIAMIAQNAVVEKDLLWPGGVVPFTFTEDDFNSTQTNLIRDAMKDMMLKTCIKFIPRIDEKAYITFVKSSDGCYSYVGQTQKQQFINLQASCLTMLGEVQHELMHALGFEHEQSRMDRDQYVRVVYQNIPPSMHNQFAKYRGITSNLPYDYNSILHYAHNAFAKRSDEDIPTILPNAGTASIGNRVVMSVLDVKRINLLYECPTTPAPDTTTTETIVSTTTLTTQQTSTDDSTDASSTDTTSTDSTSVKRIVTATSKTGKPKTSISRCPANPNGLHVDNCQSAEDCISSELGTMCCTFCISGNRCNNYCTI
ncbi:putative Zinc metalloproteinase nas-14 [Hypsibius exemplaris]|uniref:Metalloendopeptidase n=1 Tax=Hypsibius exemplaris TaxID=2072580 RepID=A0A1W0WEN3_HYPEX|nr:putative Zinc metalloproteinase nas-14 [Hypsibius exemplaris]